MYNFLYVHFTLLHLYNYYYMEIMCTIYVYDNKDITVIIILKVAITLIVRVAVMVNIHINTIGIH